MIATAEIEYSYEDTMSRGFIAYKKNNFLKRPAVMVAHDWGGRSDFFCNKARELAAMGYIGFAIDMYGQAQLGHNKIEKRALLTPLMNNRSNLLGRITAAYNSLVHLPQVDPDKIAAIGYCFGGLCVLDLARSGAPVKGVVSFHGSLLAPEDALNASINAKILILHGYDDPLVKPDQITMFATEMNHRSVDWQAHLYSQTQHSFAIPGANDEEMGLHYNKKTDERSWKSTVGFLQEILS